MDGPPLNLQEGTISGFISHLKNYKMSCQVGGNRGRVADWIRVRLQKIACGKRIQTGSIPVPAYLDFD